MAYRIGVAVGGTFTDCVAIDESTGAVRTAKVPATDALTPRVRLSRG